MLMGHTTLNALVITFRASWFTKGQYLLGQATPGCAVTLSMRVNSLQDGEVEFVYKIKEYGSMAFFTIRNDHCSQLPGKSFLLQYTGENNNVLFKIPIPKGRSILQWYIFADNNLVQLQRAQIELERIKVTGSPPIMHCNPCPAGTFGDKKGMGQCLPCPVNTFSTEGSRKCVPCSDTEYSSPRSASCTARKPCTENDYTIHWKPCAQNGMTKKIWNWIEPMICDEKTGVKLPPVGSPIPCNVCPVGTRVGEDTGTCVFCDDKRESKQRKNNAKHSSCFSCSKGKIFSSGLAYYTWSRMPPLLGPSCSNSSEPNCRGWELSFDHIGVGETLNWNSPASLELNIPHGFVRPSLEEEAEWYGWLSFAPPIPGTFLRVELEVLCESSCTLMLQRGSSLFEKSTIAEWSGTVPRQNYTLQIYDARRTTFTWIFQKHSSQLEQDIQHSHDRVKIYQIEVTNTKSTGFIGCRSCANGIRDGKCIYCPPGLFYERRLNQTTHEEVINCTSCPNGTVVVADATVTSTVSEACVACEAGTKSVNHSVCVIDVNPTTSSGTSYNLTDLLSQERTVDGRKMFTPAGNPYHQQFRLTLKHGKYVRCYETIKSDVDRVVESLICRHTIVQLAPGQVNEVYSKPISIADQFIKAIPSNHSKTFWEEVNSNLTRAGWPKDEIGSDMHYIFSANTASGNCPSGFTTIVTLRCETAHYSVYQEAAFNASLKQGPGYLELPPLCPDGTCDGCTYHLLWTSSLACPLCRQQDFKQYLGECRYGSQDVYLVKAVNCQIPDDVPLFQHQRCPLMSTGQIVIVFLVIFAMVFMCWTILVFYRRNRKLEHKYMKLVASTKGIHQPTSCALESHEDDSVDGFGRRTMRSMEQPRPFQSTPAMTLGSTTLSGATISTINVPRFSPMFFKNKNGEDKVKLTDNEVTGGMT